MEKSHAAIPNHAAVQSHAANQSHSLRDFEQHLSDLKKENFSLKLRIYFLEERVQKESPDPDLSKTNIELKVELQNLKKNLNEKEQLLQQLSTAELLSNQNQREDEATNQIQESLEPRLQQLQQELEQRRQSETSLQRLHKQALDDKDRVICELSSEKQKLEQKLQEINNRKRPHPLQLESEQRDPSELKRVMEEQSDQLTHCESTTDQCLKELQDVQKQTKTLQTKIRISEDRNRLLQKRLGEMEVELRSVREEAQNQERNIQNLTDSLSSKELEAADLLRVVEEQNRALSLKAASHAQVNPGEAAVVQSELFSLQLALDSAHRTLKSRDRTEKDLRVALERVESDLRGALQRGRERLRHNQELQQVLDQTRTCLKDSEEQLRDQQNQLQRLNQDRNQILGDLKERLSQKERMVQNYRDLLDSTDQDSEVSKLRQILQDQEQDLERVLLDRTQTLARSQEQERQLQELVKDKNHNLQAQRQVLLNNEEKIRSLEGLVQGQNLQMEQLRESLKMSGLKKDQVESELNRTFCERDSVVQGLQEVLQEREQEVQDLRSLLSHNPLLPDDVMGQLKLRLQLKDRLLQEVMSQRARQIQNQQDQVQDLIRTIDQRDQYIQDSSPRFLEFLKEQNDIIKELRTQLSFGLNPDQNQDLDQDQVWILKERLKKTHEHQDQVQKDLEEKSHLVKELVLELQRLRGRPRVDCDPDQRLISGSELAEEVPVSGGGGAVDLGYETCEKSETEAERDTSSPEFDDLEMCLSLDHGPNWWNSKDLDQELEQDQDEDHNQTPTLSPDHSGPHRPTEVQQLQRLVQHLKSELNRSKIQVQRLQSQSECGSQIDPDITDLLSRVESLENQIKTEPRVEKDEKSKTGYLGLVHLQARELSHLRQVLRESRGLVQILVQSLSEQLKGLETLLTSGEPDHSQGQRLREQLQEIHELMERLSTKISLKELPEDPDDKTELLAMRLSKELQQKDLLIQSLRSKLCSDTPSESSDQSDCISYVSEGQLSNPDEDLGSETNSELQINQSLTSSQSGHSNHYSIQSNGSINRHGQSESFSNHTEFCSMLSSVPPSVASAHSFPMMHCCRPSLGHPPSGDPRLRPIVALSQPGFSSSSLDSGLKPELGRGPGLPLGSGAFWDMPLNRPITQQHFPGTTSFHSLTGSDLLGEHLSEVRSLRFRLEESIQTNERLRLHLETHLDPPPSTAPTNIYIQSPESTETRVLRETNLNLKNQLQDSLLESERLREVLLLVQTRLKEAELQVQLWVEQSRKSQSEAKAQIQEVTRLQQEVRDLREEKQCGLQLTQRLQGEVQHLQQELRERQSDQNEVSRSQSERKAGKKLQFTDCSKSDSRPGTGLEPDSHSDSNRSTEDSGSEPQSDQIMLTEDSLRLQGIIQKSVAFIQTVKRTLKTRTKPELVQDCERLRVLLQEALTLSQKTLSTKDPQQVDHLQESVCSQGHSLNRNKEDLERLIVSQLLKTRDVLRKAKTNLQAIRGDVSVS